MTKERELDRIATSLENLALNVENFVIVVSREQRELAVRVTEMDKRFNEIIEFNKKMLEMISQK